MRRALLVCVVTFLPAVTFGQGLFPNSGSAGGQAGSGGRGNSGGQSTTTGGLSTPSTPQTVNRSGGSTNASTSSGGSNSGANSTGSNNSYSNSVGQGSTQTVGSMSGQQILDSTAVGNSAFTGRAEPGSFIGVRTTTQQANMNAFNQIFQGLQRNSGGSGRGNSNQAPAERFQIRPTLRVGFDHTPITATASVSSPRFEQRFTGITERRPQLAGVNISSDYEGRVVLRGTVASEDSKKLAAALLRLEPGVRDIVNEITVEPPAAR